MGRRTSGHLILKKLMKIIILAAGMGARLRPHTDFVPKCMVPMNGKPLIDYQLDAIEKVALDDIIIVGGYRFDVLKSHLGNRNLRNLTLYENKDFSSTNMVATLFCAEKELGGDVIIAYSDIVYRPEILQTLIDCPADRATIVDAAWQELWEKRMENPLDDAETMKIDSNGNIVELGKKPKSYDEIQGQYIGLTKISASVIDEMVRFYRNLDQSVLYDGKNFDNMFMTSFLQRMIDNNMPIKAAMISGGWFEVDSNEDLDYYTQTNFCSL